MFHRSRKGGASPRRSLSAFQTTGLVLMVAVPVPLVAASGMALPLPAWVESVASSLVPGGIETSAGVALDNVSGFVVTKTGAEKRALDAPSSPAPVAAPQKDAPPKPKPKAEQEVVARLAAVEGAPSVEPPSSGSSEVTDPAPTTSEPDPVASPAPTTKDEPTSGHGKTVPAPTAATPSPHPTSTPPPPPPPPPAVAAEPEHGATEIVHDPTPPADPVTTIVTVVTDTGGEVLGNGHGNNGNSGTGNSGSGSGNSGSGNSGSGSGSGSSGSGTCQNGLGGLVGNIVNGLGGGSGNHCTGSS